MAPRGPRTTPFGSVWDSQLGTSAAPSSANLTPLSDDDEDFDEPEIPEYLIAEQRRGARGGGAARGPQGGRGGPRGGRSAYQSAVERERYGGGRSGGINRYPDVSGRTGGPAGQGGNGAPRGPRDDRGGRRDERPRDAAPRPTSSAEPWSEVPPELEAMLRAQVGQKPAPAAGTSRPITVESIEAVMEDVAAEAAATEAETAAPKRRTTRKATTTKASTASAAETGETAAPKRRSTRKTAATDAGGGTAGATSEDVVASRGRPGRHRCRRRSRRPEAADDAQGGRLDWRQRAETADHAQDRVQLERPRLSLTAMEGARTRGHPAALAAVAAMIRGGAPHAVLLVGTTGIGKTTLALDLAAGLLCTADDVADRPCGACRACRLVASGSHPDLHRLGPEGPGRQVLIGGPGPAHAGSATSSSSWRCCPSRAGRASRSSRPRIG